MNDTQFSISFKLDPGEQKLVPALKKLYNALEALSKAIKLLATAISTSKKCRGANEGNLHKIAIALEVVFGQIEKLNNDLNKVVKKNGQVKGNLNPVDSDILKLASGINSLAQKVRVDAANDDFFSGDFKGVDKGLDDCANALDALAKILERITGSSRKDLVEDINKSKVDVAIKDLQASIVVLKKAMMAHLDRCGATPDAVANIPTALAELNKELKDVYVASN